MDTQVNIQLRLIDTYTSSVQGVAFRLQQEAAQMRREARPLDVSRLRQILTLLDQDIVHLSHAVAGL